MNVSANQEDTLNFIELMELVRSNGKSYEKGYGIKYGELFSYRYSEDGSYLVFDTYLKKLWVAKNPSFDIVLTAGNTVMWTSQHSMQIGQVLNGAIVLSIDSYVFNKLYKNVKDIIIRNGNKLEDEMNHLLQTVHVSKDGKTELVASMDTRHLLNVIRLWLRRLEKEVDLSKKPMNEYQSRLYGLKTIDPTAAADKVNQVFDSLAPYFFEAFLRIAEINQDAELIKTYSNIMNLIEKVITRNAKLPDLTMPALPDHIGMNFDLDDEDPLEERDPDEGDR